MAVISSQNSYSVGLGGIYSSRMFQGYRDMVMLPIPIYASRIFQGYTDMAEASIEIYGKTLFASTEVDTMTSSLYKPILNGGTIGNLSFDAKYIAAGPISEPIRPLYGVLWPKGHK